jgi:lysozyme family protein
MDSNIQIDELNAFKKSLEFTLKWEGGYVNDPDDPGGETKWGISKRAYPSLSIKELSPERASEIYYRDYWTKAGCGNIPFPLSTAVFDTAVNLGVNRAKNFCSSDITAGEYLLKRRNYYIHLVKEKPTFQKYLKGWLNRVADLEKFIEVQLAS